jgi:uncharacterized protein (DUF1015 family)
VVVITRLNTMLDTMPGTDHPSAVGTIRENAGLVLGAFRGLRYAPDHVSDVGAVTSPPYDVVDDEEARRLEAAEQHNFVRLILPRGNGRRRRDTHAEPEWPGGRSQHARDLLRSWLADGTLVADPAPALYVYEQQTPTAATQRGLIGALGLRDPADQIVLPHEDVLPGPVADRLELMRTTQANLEPIFLLYEGGGPASQLVDKVADREPPAVTASAGGARHRLWTLTDAQWLAAVSADLRGRQALIADGHHRYAAYLRLRDEQRAAGLGPGPWDFGLALLVDSTAFPPEVRAIHRVVDRLSLDSALAAAAPHFRVRALDGSLADSLAELGSARTSGPAFVLARGERRHLLHAPARRWLASAPRRDRPPRVRGLDATLMIDCSNRCGESATKRPGCATSTIQTPPCGTPRNGTGQPCCSRRPP